MPADKSIIDSETLKTQSGDLTEDQRVALQEDMQKTVWGPEKKKEEEDAELEEDDANPHYGNVKGAPSPLPGVGSASVKLWKDTVVRLPKEEAKRVVREDIGVAEID